MQIIPSQALSFGSEKAYFDAWGTAAGDIVYGRTPEGEFARTAIVTAWGGLAVGSAMKATAGIRLGMSYYRNPALMILANHARSGAVRSAAGAMLQGSKAIRYAGYIQMSLNPLMTYKYARRGDYRRAALNYFGPVGTVWVYNKMTRQYEKDTKQPSVVKPIRKLKTKKPSKISEAQKKRMWRMGLRWCKKHQRYDRCSLRGR